MNHNFKDISGQRFGKVIVLKYDSPNNRGQALWLCKCDCGKEQIIAGYHLRSGHTQSCSKSCGKIGRVKKIYKNRKFKSKLSAVWYNRYSRFFDHALERNHSVEITDEQFYSIVTKSCTYCGGFSKQGFNGIDRQNNDLEYTIENSVPCCWMCNRMKFTSDTKAFLEHITKIYKYQND